MAGVATACCGCCRGSWEARLPVRTAGDGWCRWALPLPRLSSSSIARPPARPWQKQAGKCLWVSPRSQIRQSEQGGWRCRGLGARGGSQAHAGPPPWQLPWPGSLPLGSLSLRVAPGPAQRSFTQLAERQARGCPLAGQESPGLALPLPRGLGAQMPHVLPASCPVCGRAAWSWQPDRPVVCSPWSSPLGRSPYTTPVTRENLPPVKKEASQVGPSPSHTGEHWLCLEWLFRAFLTFTRVCLFSFKVFF